MSIGFQDRRHAGRMLADALARYAGQSDVVVLALPRGGVPVAFEVARKLDVPLDVFVVRKLGVPGHEELAMGALASGEVIVRNDDVIRALAIEDDDIEAVEIRERAELARRERQYRGDAPPLDLTGKIALLVDDGIATGSSMRAAVAAIALRGAVRIVIAAPVAPREAIDALTDDEHVDEIAVLDTPSPFYSVGSFYVDFEQTTDEEVHALLAASHLPESTPAITARVERSDRDVHIAVPSGSCAASLDLPRSSPRGLVVIAHASASGRLNPRTAVLAESLRDGGFATLRADLLTDGEEQIDALTRSLRFDVSFLAERVLAFLDFVAAAPQLAGLPLGLYASANAGAAVLVAAARRTAGIGAVVVRGGWPDRAGEDLPHVRAPVLLVVGARDEAVLQQNRDALAHITAPKDLVVVPGATHLFEEPGALDHVARHARAWFARHLAESATAARP